MKLHYASTVLIAGLLGVMPVQAAVATIGLTPAAGCFQAAATASHTGSALSKIPLRDALAGCTEALADKLRPEDRVATLVNRGTIEAAAGDTDKALADYDAALALRPGMADIYIDRGAVLMRALRYEDARADFDKALSLGVNRAYIAYFDRGMAHEKSGNAAAAYLDYKHTLALAPDFQPAKDELSRFRIEERVAADR